MSDIERSFEPLQPQRGRDGTLQALIETLLDRGLVINADITVSVGGTELLGIRIRAALASFDTAARYGLDFPGGTNRETKAWGEALELKETCPQCGKVSLRQQLLDESCPWCGWRSARALEAEAEPEPEPEPEPGPEPEDGFEDEAGSDLGYEGEQEEEPAADGQDRRAPTEPVRRRD
jgi:rRNA maturation protein Nop10